MSQQSDEKDKEILAISLVNLVLPFHFQGHKEWLTEVNVLGVVEHPNLVRLFGYCAEDDERGIQRLLVYEYMPNRSVEYQLSQRISAPLTWAMRLKIALDAARGLTYLHKGMDFQVPLLFYIYLSKSFFYSDYITFFCRVKSVTHTKL